MKYFCEVTLANYCEENWPEINQFCYIMWKNVHSNKFCENIYQYIKLKTCVLDTSLKKMMYAILWEFIILFLQNFAKILFFGTNSREL